MNQNEYGVLLHLGSPLCQGELGAMFPYSDDLQNADMLRVTVQAFLEFPFSADASLEMALQSFGVGDGPYFMGTYVPRTFPNPQVVNRLNEFSCRVCSTSGGRSSLSASSARVG